MQYVLFDFCSFEQVVFCCLFFVFFLIKRGQKSTEYCLFFVHISDIYILQRIKLSSQASMSIKNTDYFSFESFCMFTFSYLINSGNENRPKTHALLMLLNTDFFFNAFKKKILNDAWSCLWGQL